MTLTGLFIILGTVVLAVAIIKAIDRFANRNIKRVEIEHLGAGVEADRRKTTILNGDKHFTI